MTENERLRKALEECVKVLETFLWNTAELTISKAKQALATPKAEELTREWRVTPLSKLPFKYGPISCGWDEFIRQSNEMSPDKEKYTPYVISAADDAIVCMFGPGPGAQQNAEFVIDCIDRIGTPQPPSNSEREQREELTEIIADSLVKTVVMKEDGEASLPLENIVDAVLAAGFRKGRT